MAEIKSNLVDLEVVYNKLNATIDKNINLLKEGATAVDAYNKKISVVPSEFQKSLTDIKTKMDSVSVSTKKLEQTEKQLQQARLKELQLAKQREQAFDKYEKSLAREQGKLAAAETMYGRIQNSLNLLNNSYRDLALRKELNGTLTKQEEANMARLQSRIQTYDKALKAVDASIGKYQRNVGNYASGFNPLSNSINQLTREMPAFTYSVQTGFMALSNNIPIFTDAIGNAIRQNKELIAQGKPTTSVLNQLAGALFSFQTLLGVGITLLTVYGKEIGDWTSQLLGANNALNELNKSQKEFNEAKFTGKKDAQSEIIELRKYLAVAKDVKISDEERNIALKQLRSQFPFYFKDLTDAQILAGNYSKAEKELTIALEKRKDVEKKTELNVANRQKLLDIEKEKAQLLKDQEKVEKSLESVRANISSGAGRGATGLMEEQSRVRSRLNELNKQYTFIQENLIENENAIFKLKKETIGLEYTEEKDKEAKSVNSLNLELKDYIASQYALLKLQKEMNVESNKQIFDDENQTLENRLSSYERYISGKTELEIDAFNESKRLLELSYSEELNSLKEKYSDYIKQEGVTSYQRISAKKEFDRAILALDKKTKADLGILEQQHSINILEITKKFYEDQRKLRSLYANLSENKKFQEIELRDLQQHQLRLKNIDLKTTQKRIDEIDKLNEDAQKESTRKRLQLRVDEINKELDYVEKGSAQELKLRTELYLKLKEISNLESADLEKKKKEQEDYLKLLSNTYKGFVDDFVNQSGFSGLIDILSGGLDKFKGDAVSTALTVSEAFQQAFNTISEASQANFDAEYERLEKQRDFAIEMAGGSATAKEEIDRQYDERKKAIQRREAEAQKRLAIFNIVTNTAQAILATYAKVGFPAGIPLAIAMGAIGAFQVGLVASQEIPQFWKGTDNAPEGLAWTQEKGAEVITDKNGNVKTLGSDKGAQLTYLSKGDKVYKSHEDYINKVLSKNGISDLGSYINFAPQKEVNNSFDMAEMKQEFSKLASVIKNKDGVNISIDEKGFRKKQGNTEFINSRLNLTSRQV